MKSLREAGIDDEFLQEAPPIFEKFNSVVSAKSKKVPGMMVRALEYADRASEASLELEQAPDGSRNRSGLLRLWAHLNSFLARRWVARLRDKLSPLEVEQSGLKLPAGVIESSRSKYCQTLREMVNRFDTLDRNHQKACIETCFFYSDAMGRLAQGPFGVSFARLATFNPRQVFQLAPDEAENQAGQGEHRGAISRELVLRIEAEPEKLLAPLTVAASRNDTAKRLSPNELLLILLVRQRAEPDAGVTALKQVAPLISQANNAAFHLEAARTHLLIQGDAVGAVREVELALSKRTMNRPVPSSLGTSLGSELMTTPYMFEQGPHIMLSFQPIFSFLEQQRREQVANKLNQVDTTRLMLRLADALTQSDYFLDRELGIAEGSKAARRLLETSISNDQRIQLTLFSERLNAARQMIPEFSQGILFTKSGIRGVSRSNGSVIKENCIIINPDGGFLYGRR